MKTYTGGEIVKGGYYFNLREWRLDVVEGRRGTLPEHARYVRVPALLMLALAPIMGLLFVMFLPFIGLAVLIDHVGRWMYKLATVRRKAPLRG
jgi:hypothetical protein